MEIIKDKRVLKIIEKLKNAVKLTQLEGHVYLVGGVIRDSLLNQPIHDLDIVVEKDGGGILVANLLAAKEKSYMINTNPVIFPTYGTAKVSLFRDEELKDINIEFVDSRKTQYVVGSKCFGTIEEDSKLRDLTINSLYYNIHDGKLYDYVGAIDDLTNQTLRTVNPDLAFVWSPIRMLRVIRFSAELGWGIEKNTWLSIISHSHLIKKAPQELISSEISKILVSPNASIAIRKMMYCGLLHRVMPDVYDLTTGYESRNPTVTAFDHTMRVLDMVQPMIENRLAALFHDVGSVVTDGYNRSMSKDMFSAWVATSDLKEMKFSNAIIDAVETAIRYHRVFGNYAEGVLPPDKKIRKFVHLVGDHIGTTIDLMNANNTHCTYGKKKTQALMILNRLEKLEDEEETKNVKLPIDGKDILERFKPRRGGNWVGILLNAVKEEYFNNPKITREEAFKIIDEKIKKIV
jgi:tRNA nucleotidyltransferase (CCA-adding enzyme)